MPTPTSLCTGCGFSAANCVCVPVEQEAEPEDACSNCGRPTNRCECAWCEVCDEPHHASDMCAVCNACTGCCDCYECSQCGEWHRSGEDCPNPRIVQPYDSRAEDQLGFFPARNGKPTLYLGVELEVEVPEGRVVDDVAEDVPDRGFWVILKHDGSLDHGFEVVTAPSVLEEHQKRWPRVVEYLRSRTFSWRAETTGIHVHLTRNWLTQLELAKFVYVINAEPTRPWIVALAGRTSPSYAALKRKRWLKGGDGEGVLEAKTRYDAVNLTKRRTVEVRIFKGTLDLEHVLADVEFVHALANWVKIASLSECDRWERFWAYVEENTKTYPNLRAYMARERIKRRIEEVKKRTPRFFESTEKED